MIPVSDEYKEAIKKDTRSFDLKSILLNVNQPEPQLIETTNSTNIGELTAIFDESPFIYKYARLEENYTQLDGTFILPNNSNNKNMEFIGNGVNCSLSFCFFPYRTSYNNENMKIIFDDGYATNFTISCYAGGTLESLSLIDTRTYTNNSEEAIVNISNMNIGEFKKIKITINSWNNNKLPKIRKIMKSNNELLNGSDIINMKMLEQTDLRGLDIPGGTLSLTLDNYNRQYNILDLNNILNKLNNNSVMKIYLGLNINGAYEYVLVGGYWYSNYKENSDKTIDFNFEGQISHQLTIRNPITSTRSLTPSEMAGGYLFGDLESDNADYIDYTGNFPALYLPYTSIQEQEQEALIFYNISARERRIITNSNSHNNGLQLFNISSLNQNVENYIISLNNQIKIPEFNKAIKTQKIRFNYNTFGSPTSGKTEIYNGNISFNETSGTYYCIKNIKTNIPIYDPATIDIYYNDTKIVDNNLVVSGSGFDSNFTYNRNGYYELTIELKTTDVSKTTGIFRVEVKSYEKINNIIEITNENVSAGAIIELNTDTIKSETDMNRISTTIFNYEEAYPYEFNIEIMGDIRLEVGDKITIESLDGYHTAIIESIDTTYNGGLTQIIKGVCSNVLQ